MKNSAKSARVIRFHETGEPEVLKIETIEIPAPGPQEVRIAVKAMGLNRADALYRRGQYLETPVFPAKIGYEAAGIVDAVGDEVTDVKAGDVVSVIPAFSLLQYATHGELILVPAYAVEKHVSSLSFEEAASLWGVYLTAYGMIIDADKIQAGQYVAINAASSAVGLAAIQTANAAGAVSIAITTTAAKKQALLNAGAHHVVVTATSDVTAELNRITAGIGVDLLLDAVGGPLLGQLIAGMAQKGKIYIYGALSPELTVIPSVALIARGLTIAAFSTNDINSDPIRQQAAKKFIYEGLENKTLKLVIAKTFGFENFVAAHHYLESNQQVGKIVVTL